MKIFVGIDIAKLNHFAAAISSDGEILIEPFKFTNDADGFQLLVSKLESFDKNSIIIGLESTAHYGDNLVRYLVAEFFISVVKKDMKKKFFANLWLTFHSWSPPRIVFDSSITI